jgi:hypothetical protein
MKGKSHRQAGEATRPAELNEAAAPPGPGRLRPTASGAAMLRTQIYLSREQHAFVQSEAARQREPMAAVIRSFIDERMRLPEEVWDHNPLLEAPADPAFVGPVDGVINHDHYVHGTPRRWIKRRGRWVAAPPLPADYYTNPASAAAYDRRLEPRR